MLSAGPGALLACFAVYEKPVDAAATEDPVNSQDVASDNIFCKSWQASWDQANAAQRIDLIRGGIAAGDYYQINLTTRLHSPFSGDAEAFFSALQDSQSGAYAAALDWGDGQILSVSPELFFQRRAGRITTRPMKGTAPREADPVRDRAAADQLRQSIKERAENLMIVDLLRNDLARIAETGSVRVESLFEVEPWPSVWQMTSTISAQPRPDVGLVELFAALFPCGSVTGAPKVAAMRAIATLEDSPRGVYCGAIGVLQPGGDAIFSVAIRTVSIRAGVATCGIGSAITYDSTAAGEYAEWMAKRRFLLRASAPFELLETLRLTIGHHTRVYRHLDRHLQRLLGSAAWFGFAADEAAIRRQLAGLAEEVARSCTEVEPSFRIRLLLARNGQLRSEVFPLDAAPTEVVVRLADRPIVGDPEFLSHKTTERRAYDAFADLPAGVFDTLLFNAQDELTEFTRGSVFLEADGVLLTPPLVCGLLPGVLRAELLASGRAKEAVLPRARLAEGGQWWFGNSLRGLIPVRLI